MLQVGSRLWQTANMISCSYPLWSSSPQRPQASLRHSPWASGGAGSLAALLGLQVTASLVYSQQESMYFWKARKCSFLGTVMFLKLAHKIHIFLFIYFLLTIFFVSFWYIWCFWCFPPPGSTWAMTVQSAGMLFGHTACPNWTCIGKIQYLHK